MAAKREPEFEIVQNKAAKSSVWTHYGFVKINDDVDKRKVACRQCNFVLKYSGNTTNLTDHLRRKHPTVYKTSQVKSKLPSLSPSLPVASPLPNSSSTETFHSIFGSNKLQPTSRRAKEITSAMAQFIVKDLRPFSVVANSGFKNLIKVLEPKYNIPARQHFSDKVIPELYTKVSSQLKLELKGNYVAITTDGWTSRATESYVTITSSHIDENWNIKNYVLQVKSGKLCLLFAYCRSQANKILFTWSV